MLLVSPSSPRSSTQRLGTMKSEIPFTPGVPPASLASTRCTMFSERLCSPPEIHILVPRIRQVSSLADSARVVISAREEPACGSESHIVPSHRPWIILYRNTPFCSSQPHFSSRGAAATGGREGGARDGGAAENRPL